MNGLLLILLAADLPPAGEIRTILGELSAITGLEARRPVRVRAQNRGSLRGTLEKRVSEAIQPKQMADDELTLKWLGLAPPDFDLRRMTIDLLTEQSAAYYDYKHRRLVMLENPLGEYDPSVLAHELAHALADQHFKLRRFFGDSSVSDDAEMARGAVVEGQATWLAAEWKARRERRGAQNRPDLPLLSAISASSGGSFPVLEKAPLYLKVTLLFPYWEGARFQQAVADRFGQRAFAVVFEQPPASTREVLHPELYLKEPPASPPDLPPLVERGWRPFSRGTLGELDHLILFTQLAEPGAAMLAGEWRGGVYELSRRGPRCCAVRYASAWADEAAASRAESAWRRHLETKSPRGTATVRRHRNVIYTIEMPPK
jgi:hypothetical protein